MFLNFVKALQNIIGDNHWLVQGDFNIITSLVKKRGGIRRLDLDSQSFRETMRQLNLIELNTINGMHNWNIHVGAEIINWHLG
jgi:hypothetical protein